MSKSQTQVIVLDANIGEKLEKLMKSLDEITSILSKQKEEIVHKYYTINQFAELHPALTKSALRKYWFFREYNNFNEVAHKKGGVIYIDSARFDEWFVKNGNGEKE